MPWRSARTAPACYIASGSTGSVHRFTTSSNPAANPPVCRDRYQASGRRQPDPGYAWRSRRTVPPCTSRTRRTATFYVIDTATDTVYQTIGVTEGPGALAVSPDGASLIIAQHSNANGDVVSRHRHSDQHRFERHRGGLNPTGVAFNPNPGLPYAYRDQLERQHGIDHRHPNVDRREPSPVAPAATTRWHRRVTRRPQCHSEDYDGGGDGLRNRPGLLQVATLAEQGGTTVKPATVGALAWR